MRHCAAGKDGRGLAAIQQWRERHRHQRAGQIGHQVEGELMRGGRQRVVLFDAAIVVMMVLHVFGVRDEVVDGVAGQMTKLPLRRGKRLQRKDQHHQDGNDSRHGRDSTSPIRYPAPITQAFKGGGSVLLRAMPILSRPLQAQSEYQWGATLSRRRQERGLTSCWASNRTIFQRDA